jgi:ABC-type lipoprotein release transport system permease subunit
MYKLFLTFRYLTRKKIVIFPVLVVWLCVMMLIIVTSIMGGFVERVRAANRDLFGDIIISAGVSTRGFSGYDELRQHLQQKFPDILATTPVVQAYSILYAPQKGASWPGLLVGVKPEERERVTRFRETLFFGYEAPMQAVEDLKPRLPATAEQLVAYADERAKQAETHANETFDKLQDVSRSLDSSGVPKTRPDYRWMWGIGPAVLIAFLLIWRAHARRAEGRGGGAYFTAIVATLICLVFIGLGTCWPMLFPRQYDLAEDQFKQASEVDAPRAERTAHFAHLLPAAPSGTYKSADELAGILVVKNASFDVPPGLAAGLDGAPDGCIVGTQIMAPRDKRGNFIHNISPPFAPVTLTVFPPEKNGRINTTALDAVSHKFTVIDDSHTGVYDVDATNIYAPFEIVQQMAGMAPDPELVKQDPTSNFAPRCHELLIKLKPQAEPNIRAMKALIEAETTVFMDDYAKTHLDADSYLTVQTWDERQAKYLGAVENEKVMMTFILLLMSGVVIVVIFLIFYQIVRDKTRDIGIIKAVGGSEEGVAGIFLTYGLFVGVVGGGLGILSGVLFVTHTNQIHEWIYQMTGIIIWDRSVYLFDRIPDTVYTSDVITYFLVALVAGVIGALIPAVIAGAEDPVQAVRYE